MRKHEVEDFLLQKGRAFEFPYGLLSSWVQQSIVQQSLSSVDEQQIAQCLLEGKLTCGWSDQPAWEQIASTVAQYQAEGVNQLKEYNSWQTQLATLSERRQRLQQELIRLDQQCEDLKRRLAEYEEDNDLPRDLSDLQGFAKKVLPIEQRLVAELEEEMTKETPQLAALEESGSPKLSLLLNCMGVNEVAISAVAGMDGVTFKKETSCPVEFLTDHDLPAETRKNLLYCGEMLRECDFPFVDHEDQCVVCQNRSPEQLINLVKERPDIELPLDTLRKKNINGPRVLFSLSSEFPTYTEELARQSLLRLRELHEMALRDE